MEFKDGITNTSGTGKICGFITLLYLKRAMFKKSAKKSKTKVTLLSPSPSLVLRGMGMAWQRY
jgi:hypothetical protein